MTLIPIRSLFSSNSRGESAHTDVGNDREQRSSENNFERINEMRHDNLINDIERHREYEHLTDTLPAVFNKVVAGCGIGKNRP